jgi:predicted ATPase
MLGSSGVCRRAESKFSQIWITTHSTALTAAVERLTGAAPIVLEKIEGATRVVGRGILG